MVHIGDITKLDGAEIPAVDVVTGGSPCQDLSVAGKRAGLAGERSGLFLEQIRIVKEMRENDRRHGRTDELIRPRYMVWENVPGAFSSNKGRDFRAVLEETAKVADENAVIPEPPNGKWTHAGCIVGDGWSIAWRVHDAQYWGVPQRRKRICLLADFNGDSAGKILFELRREAAGRGSESAVTDPGAEPRSEVQSVGEGVSGDIKESREEGEGAAEDTKRRTGETVTVLNDQGGSVMGVSEDIVGSLRAQEHGHQPIIFEPGAASRVGGHVYSNDVAGTVRANAGDNQQAVVLDNHPADSRVKISEDNVVQTLSSRMGTGGGNVPMVMEQGFAMQAIGEYKDCDCASSLKQRDYKDSTDLVVTHGLDRASYGRSVVRRLTPLECERLQNFPDHWTDIGDWVDSKGKKHKGDADSPRYKALGNSIALPFWEWLARRICAKHEHRITMGSLFDGIGGFPLAFGRCGAIPVWASEIEDFCVAVTKRRFPVTSTSS